KPVPPTTHSMGADDSSRSSKLPKGSSTSSVSPLLSVGTICVNWPPATWRMCSCSPSLSCGGLAIEYERRLPSGSVTCRYWPALNFARWPAGRRSCSTLTSSLASVLRNTLAVKVLRADGSRRCQEAGASSTSDSGVHWQYRCWPAGLASLGGLTTSPAATPPAQLPHTPLRQE